jgi:hypothetical protein
MIVGGSGHASCVVDAAQAGSTLEVVAVVDDGAAGSAGGASTSTVLGVPVVGGTDAVARWSEGRIDGVVIGVGDNHTRLVVAERLARTVPGLAFVVSFTRRRRWQRRPGSAMVRSCWRGRRSVHRRPSTSTPCSELRPWTTTPRWPPGPACPGALTGGTVSIGRAAAVAMGAIVRHGLTIGGFRCWERAVLTRSLPDCRRGAAAR